MKRCLACIGGTWQSASVMGNLSFEGWGSDMGYPGLRLDTNGEKINRYVFSSNNLSNHWDKFEGDEYHRTMIKVNSKSEGLINTYIYVLT
ncbi:hypothetical protein [uncultured Gammaproteobacteria bacterium]|nr:hypothetical protein [uncultured Gammaproteobacteria bacterium]